MDGDQRKRVARKGMIAHSTNIFKGKSLPAGDRRGRALANKKFRILVDRKPEKPTRKQKQPMSKLGGSAF